MVAAVAVVIRFFNFPESHLKKKIEQPNSKSKNPWAAFASKLVNKVSLQGASTV